MKVTVRGMCVGWMLGATAMQADAASVFDWMSSDVTGDVDEYRLQVDGITAVIKAYVAQWDGSVYRIVGPIPTGDQTYAPIYGKQGGFVRNPASVYQSLLLQAGSALDPALAGEEVCSIGACGFDNHRYKVAAGQFVPKFNFALVAFDRPVNLDSVVLKALSNYDHDFWVGSSATAPDLLLDFGAAFSSFEMTLFPRLYQLPEASGLSGTHKGLRYLAIGAPVQAHADSGVLAAIAGPDAWMDTFGIRSFSVTAVPVPAALWLFGSGILGLIGIGVRKRVAST